MKYLLLLLIPFSVWADADSRLKERKERILAELDKRMEALKVERDCIAGADSADGLKACHQKMMEFRKSHRSERQQKFHDNMEGLLKGTQRR